VPVEALLVLGCLVVVVGLSAVLHHAVELPVVAMVRGLRRDTRPVPAVLTTASSQKEAA
jgi:peptidoglycan/LPS O-acetylase OafA/YrhL